ncbi:unnamed protein product [Clavelina lepadiformis]|uniref:SPARC-related modular calcium-binding protein 1 n=1 Tax=Clavelina lepadiformis TaxID=159417 RepID=A0ABP0GMK6_CLALP
MQHRKFFLLLAFILTALALRSSAGPPRIHAKKQPMLISGNPACNLRCEGAKRRKYCGNDGRTYVSKCKAEEAQCADPLLKVTRGKCKEGSCFQASNYSLYKQRVTGMAPIVVPSCTSDGSYATTQCHGEYCWCAKADGKMVTGSVVLREKPDCPKREASNTRRSTESCSSSRRSTLVETILNESLRDFRETSRASSLHHSLATDDTLRDALVWKFSRVDGNSNGNINSRELRTFLNKARSCVESFLQLCDTDNDQQISNGEWIVCLFTPSMLPGAGNRPDTTTARTTTADGFPFPLPRNCPSEDQIAIFDIIRNDAIDVYSRTPSTTISDLERESSAITWKFNQLDTNHNGRINYKEVRKLRRARELRRFKLRACFFEICDSDESNDLTQREWGSCFASNRRRTCKDERKKAMQLQQAQSGVYIPVCEGDEMRYFSQVQCHSSTGYCWCATRDTGRPIPRTTVQNRRPNCPIAASESARVVIPGCPKPQVFLKSLHSAIRREVDHEDAGETRSTDASRTLTEGEVLALFRRLDRNRDHLMNKKEAKAIRKIFKTQVSPKRCLRKYARYCDSDRNKKISPTEFIRCLHVPVETSEPTVPSINTTSGLS